MTTPQPCALCAAPEASHDDAACPMGWTPPDPYITALLADVPGHPLADACPVPECHVCAVRDCPHGEPLHYDDDGCPACDG